MADSSETKHCTYQTYMWNTVEKKAVGFKTVAHAYSELTREEVDPETACTLCEEDQVWISLNSIPAFRVCHLIAEDIKSVLGDLLAQQLPIREVVGYRVGKTRGETDARGNRTIYSNHSYGAALDINPDANGLYDTCLEYSPECRLIRGGVWHPDNPASLTVDGPIVRAFKQLGFRWGGEIDGKQKDFMHLSPSGY